MRKYIMTHEGLAFQEAMERVEHAATTCSVSMMHFSKAFHVQTQAHVRLMESLLFNPFEEKKGEAPKGRSQKQHNLIMSMNKKKR